MLLVDGRAFFLALLQNHLLLSDIEAQVRRTAEENFPPASVLQALGQRGQAVSIVKRTPSPEPRGDKGTPRGTEF